MELIILIIILALLQYTWFAGRVGMARGKYQIKAPAVSGHPVFERYYRVQQNTLEQLVLFIPSEFMFSYLAELQGWPGYEMAAGLGVIWIVGRGIYARSYVNDPATRGTGFLMTFGPSMLMLLLSLVLLVISLL